MKNILMVMVCLFTLHSALFTEELSEKELLTLKQEAREYFERYDHAKFAEIYQNVAKMEKGFKASTYYNYAMDLYERKAYRETIILLNIFLKKIDDSKNIYKEALSMLKEAEANFAIQQEDIKKHSHMPKDYKEMVYVASGTFEMGSLDGLSPNKHVHEVFLDSYYIGKYEVTQKVWKEVMGYNPSLTIGDARPVERINWYDAIEFCNQLSIREGLTPCYVINKDKWDPNNKVTKDKIKWIVTCDFSANGYRLPTEAEWEFAARGGILSKGYPYSGSDDVSDVAGIWEGTNKDIRFTNTIGSKKANELGINDMSGNVSEWCWDWFGWNYYKDSPLINPKGMETSIIGRIVRGGSAFHTKMESSGLVYIRGSQNPSLRWRNIGLRLVRTVEPDTIKK